MTFNHRKKSAAAAKTVVGAPDATLQAFTKTIADRIVLLSLADLKLNARRSRTHDENQIAMIMGSFNTFGLINPLIVDERNTILAGHARFEAARRLGIAKVPAVRIDHLSDTEKRAYVIADNRIAEKAGWDIEVLAGELEFLTSIQFDTEVIGFDTQAIDLVIDEAAARRAGPDPADDLADPVPGPAVSRLGDVFLLGRHRLVCDSALEGTAYQKAMGGKVARMLLTDPPYNVPISGFVSGLGKVQHREFAMASGEMSGEEFRGFLRTMLSAVSGHVVDGALLYVFMDWRGQFSVMQAAGDLGLRQHNLCVWDKMSGGMGSHYRSQHELCLVYKYGTAPHLNMVELGCHGRNRTNVWQHPGMSSFGKGREEALAMHPTVKPVGLLVEAIKDCTRRGDVVLDPFLGSGSTLIAAEKSGRICCGIELDPLYVDTIIRRFEALTGIEVTHEASGRTFTEIATMRASEQATEVAESDQRSEVAASERDVGDLAACDNPSEPRIRGRLRRRLDGATPADGQFGGERASEVADV